MKRLLMIAYHFPPLTSGSGLQRSLRFAQHLPDHGWKPLVLSVHPRAHGADACRGKMPIPSGIQVVHAPAWDAARHFALAGRYPRLLALPDRWASWWPGAVLAGLALLRRHSADAIWSTYPIATAHRIGRTLARLSGLPWIADFRDPMAHEGYPPDPRQWRSFLAVERAAIRHAAFSTFTTPSAVRFYQDRYPEVSERICLIENGYCEDALPTERTEHRLNPGKLTLLHSGIVYPSERDPTQLMQALGHLKEQCSERLAHLVLRFRAPMHGDLLQALAEAQGVSANVQVLPPIGHAEAVAEMAAADALLLLQAANCNMQIPAKFYEYLVCRRPIVALTDPAGDTAQALRAVGGDAIAPLDDAAAIANLLSRFVAEPSQVRLPAEAAIAAASRRARSRQLAALLDRCVGGAGRPSDKPRRGDFSRPWHWREGE
ncbi:hypothetical protein ThidrDRAFT_3709 [Thiorhodococcus drewsii AZ1]|uniref:Glycosyltransferase subfamily 4-like N-terminal domain-containing protein n=1 Tax=Thiorhodococcus drewsii AZ1 TaxID=765913 RepID=G2E5Z6_9GAMM|nr:hypothetical protein [Thiorhodococcus drewsii]EGV28481.1 hypothetical protein ThidrDRAFT_3709 [Thiorhodococcus drewsii AZ1]